MLIIEVRVFRDILNADKRKRKICPRSPSPFGRSLPDGPPGPLPQRFASVARKTFKHVPRQEMWDDGRVGKRGESIKSKMPRTISETSGRDFGDQLKYGHVSVRTISGHMRAAYRGLATSCRAASLPRCLRSQPRCSVAFAILRRLHLCGLLAQASRRPFRAELGAWCAHLALPKTPCTCEE